MHLRIVQQRLAFIQTNLIRTYKHQTKVFGYNTQLKTHGNVNEIEKTLCKYIQFDDDDNDKLFFPSICR